MGPAAHAAVPVIDPVLRAVDGRGVVVAALRQLQQEVHLLPRRLVDEVLVYD